MGPIKKARAAPKLAARVPMAVAVVRSLGGNQVVDTKGGAPFGIKLGSIAIRWPMKIKIVLTVRSRKGIT